MTVSLIHWYSMVRDIICHIQLTLVQYQPVMFNVLLLRVSVSVFLNQFDWMKECSS